MEKNIGREIKVLRSDSGREYTSYSFLQLCCNEGTKGHFIVREISQQNRVTERMNMTLLKKVHYTLSNTGLSKSFRARH